MLQCIKARLTSLGDILKYDQISLSCFSMVAVAARESSMKLLTDASEYALRATAWMAMRPGVPQKVREIAEATHAAPGYLVKVLQSLAKAGILSAQRGSTGGYSLLRDPATLTVFEIINAVDPMERIHTCPLGLSTHGKDLCPMHRRVDDAMAAIETSFRETTIHDLISTPSRSTPLCNALTVEGEAVKPRSTS
jgi:Rrf2 family transcriptional regulator, nitric oxide-sensitive transcriptional repressor